MGFGYNKSQFKRICCLCSLADFLSIGLGRGEFENGLAKAKNKQRYEDEIEKSLKTAVRNHICSVGRDVFADEIKQFNQTLPKGEKKHHLETWLTLAGLDTKSNRKKYHEYMNRYFDGDNDLGLSYESWLEHCC